MIIIIGRGERVSHPLQFLKNVSNEWNSEYYIFLHFLIRDARFNIFVLNFCRSVGRVTKLFHHLIRFWQFYHHKLQRLEIVIIYVFVSTVDDEVGYVELYDDEDGRANGTGYVELDTCIIYNFITFLQYFISLIWCNIKTDGNNEIVIYAVQFMSCNLALWMWGMHSNLDKD